VKYAYQESPHSEKHSLTNKSEREHVFVRILMSNKTPLTIKEKENPWCYRLGGRGLRVYEGLWGNLFLKEPRSSICFFYPCHCVLTNLTPGALVSVRSLITRPFDFVMLLPSYVLYVCVQ
jgi:hypothetical protein